MATAYRMWGREFRPEWNPLGWWTIVGRAEKLQPIRLDKMGAWPDRQMAEAALERWAYRMGLRGHIGDGI